MAPRAPRRARVRLLLAALALAATVGAQCTQRDLVIANLPVGTGDWSLERLTSAGSLHGFGSNRFALCTGRGTVQVIEPGESFARGLLRVLVSESQPTPPYSRSVLYTFHSPFLRSASFQSCPADRFDFPSGWVVTDVKADQVFTANEAFWFVYLDTNVTPARLVLQRGSTLGPGASVVLSTTARTGFVSIDEANGLVRVFDDGGILHTVDPITLAWSAILVGGPPIVPTDMVYDPVPSLVPGRIVVVGVDPTNPGVGLLRRYTLAGAMSYQTAMPGLLPSSLSVDDAGDCYFLAAGAGGSGILHADNRTNALTAVFIRTAPATAVSWIGRTARDVFKTWPGTRAMDAVLARPAWVDGTSLDYTVRPTRPLAGLFFTLSDRFRLDGMLLGPEGEVLVDLASPNLVVLPVPGPVPDIRLPMPVSCALNGSVWHSQFLGVDLVGAWVASSLVSFTVGRRPRE